MAKPDLRSRAWSAMLAHAVFRLESAGTIALTILLAYFVPEPFPGWQWWYWVVAGAAAEVLIIVSSLRDVDTGAQVVSDMLREEFNPGVIRTPKYRQAVEQALNYRARIEQTIRQSEAGILQQHLLEFTSGISNWLAQIFRLARRLDEYERDEMIHADAKSAPEQLRELEARVRRSGDPGLRGQAEHTLETKRAQVENLNKIARTMEEADLQLQATLTALGTVYSQLVLIRNKDDIQDSRAQRLRASISEQVARLASLQESMDEVYARKQTGVS